MKKLLIVLSLLLISSKVYALEINLSIIAEIESSNNPLARGDCFKEVCRSLGLLQLQERVIREYNRYYKVHLRHLDALEPKIARKVASHYLNHEIPRLLKFYGIPDTLPNRLATYNAGIQRVRKGRIPASTKLYIKKYRLLKKKYV